MKGIRKKGLLILCLLCLVFVISPICFSDFEAPPDDPPPPDDGDDGDDGDSGDDGEVPPDEPPPPDDGDDGDDGDSGDDGEVPPDEPEDMEESWLQELQDVYGFTWQEIKEWEKEFGLDQLRWAMLRADRDKEEFLKFLYGYTLEGLSLLPSYKIGETIVLKFTLRNNHTGELMDQDQAGKLAANLTAALINGKAKELVILDQNRRDICLLAIFDPETKQFIITWNTTGSRPGIYELYLGIFKNFCGHLAPFDTILVIES